MAVAAVAAGAFDIDAAHVSSGMANMLASCLRRLWVACDADQEVSLPSLNSATAQDGPIEPCVWMAKS